MSVLRSIIINLSKPTVGFGNKEAQNEDSRKRWNPRNQVHKFIHELNDKGQKKFRYLWGILVHSDWAFGKFHHILTNMALQELH